MSRDHPAGNNPQPPTEGQIEAFRNKAKIFATIAPLFFTALALLATFFLAPLIVPALAISFGTALSFGVIGAGAAVAVVSAALGCHNVDKKCDEALAQRQQQNAAPGQNAASSPHQNSHDVNPASYVSPSNTPSQGPSTTQSHSHD